MAEISRSFRSQRELCEQLNINHMIQRIFLITLDNSEHWNPLVWQGVQYRLGQLCWEGAVPCAAAGAVLGAGPACRFPIHAGGTDLSVLPR